MRCGYCNGTGNVEEANRAAQHESIASLIALRIYGSKLTELEGATMDGCRGLATDIMDMWNNFDCR